MTGADLVRQLQLAARARKVTLGSFVAPLTSDPRKFIRQLDMAKTPKPATIDRIDALIQGRPIPAAPRNDFQSRRRSGWDQAGYPARAVARQLETKAEIERRLTLSRLAHERKLPGETLQAAALRIEADLRA